MDTTVIKYKREVSKEGRTMWSVLYDDAVIGRVERYRSLGRGFSKSQMCTRHVLVWAGTVANAELSDDDRRAVQQHIRRDKTSREAAVDHIIEAYARSGVQLPTAVDKRRAA
jgi:hypothetical protein